MKILTLLIALLLRKPCSKAIARFYRQVGLRGHGSPVSVKSKKDLSGGYELGRVSHDRVPKLNRLRDRWWQRREIRLDHDDYVIEDGSQQRPQCQHDIATLEAAAYKSDVDHAKFKERAYLGVNHIGKRERSFRKGDAWYQISVIQIRIVVSFDFFIDRLT